MAIQEIEEGWREFRTVFINKQGEMESDLENYYIRNREDVKTRLKALENYFKDLRGAKSVIRITHKPIFSIKTIIYIMKINVK